MVSLFNTLQLVMAKCSIVDGQRFGHDRVFTKRWDMCCTCFQLYYLPIKQNDTFKKTRNLRGSWHS